MCDFETTVYDGQTNTEVWAAACVELFTEDVHIFHSIAEQFAYLRSIPGNIVVYYHNLKFDGSFWLSYLKVNLGWPEACTRETHTDENGNVYEDFSFLRQKDMKNNTFTYSISNMGQWYQIVLKCDERFIEIRDSLKLLPFSVKRIGDSFKTKHRKLEMEYTGFRYAGCEITEQEQEYIANDVLVVKEALEIMFQNDHKRLTIGSCCLAEFKKTVGRKYYDDYFPDLYALEIDPEFGAPSAGEYIHKSYRGGWCYLCRGKEKKLFKQGVTADVNSLYPSMMSSESLNRYPVGMPHFWKGNIIPDEALSGSSYYFVRIRTRFYLKKDKLPFVQMKSNLMYKPTEMLETSDVLNRKDGKRYPFYYDIHGNLRPAVVEMTLTMTDFQLLVEHYELVDFEILDGCWFSSVIGIFDEYIDKYKKLKLESKGALRELAKLFLNNLYGKMAANTSSSFKVAYVKEDRSLGFYEVQENNKKPGYIPIGSAITSYARNFTIRAAQKNYHGPDKPGFIYADTDSIHCDLLPEQVQGIKVHPKDFCCWKLESTWVEGWFIRQKTYIEHVVAEGLQPIETPYYNIKCAGMPQRCKDLFLISMSGYDPDNPPVDPTGKPMVLQGPELEFVKQLRKLEDFNVGLRVPGKLLPKRIPGGTLLVGTYYEMR